MHRLRHLALAGLLVALAGTACSEDAEKGASGGGKSAGAGSIDIKQFTFQPSPLTAKAGSTIAVTNSDDAPHTLTANDKSVDTGNLNKGDKKTITVPSKPGALEYRCSIHNYMTGVIQVSA